MTRPKAGTRTCRLLLHPAVTRHVEQDSKHSHPLSCRRHNRTPHCSRTASQGAWPCTEGVHANVHAPKQPGVCGQVRGASPTCAKQPLPALAQPAQPHGLRRCTMWTGSHRAHDSLVSSTTCRFQATAQLRLGGLAAASLCCWCLHMRGCRQTWLFQRPPKGLVQQQQRCCAPSMCCERLVGPHRP